MAYKQDMAVDFSLVRFFVKVGDRKIEILSILLISAGINIMTGILSDHDVIFEQTLASILLILGGIEFFLESGRIHEYREVGEENHRLMQPGRRKKPIEYAIEATLDVDPDSPPEKPRKMYQIDAPRIWRAMLFTLLGFIVLFYAITRLPESQQASYTERGLPNVVEQSQPAANRGLIGLDCDSTNDIRRKDDIDSTNSQRSRRR